MRSGRGHYLENRLDEFLSSAKSRSMTNGQFAKEAAAATIAAYGRMFGTPNRDAAKIWATKNFSRDSQVVVSAFRVPIGDLKTGVLDDTYFGIEDGYVEIGIPRGSVANFLKYFLAPEPLNKP